MVIKCPRCGKEYDISDAQAPTVFRCQEPACRSLFAVNLTGTDASGNAARSVPAEEKKDDPSPDFGGNDQPVSADVNAAKALAMDYFSDLPSVEPPEAPAQELPAEKAPVEAHSEALRHMVHPEEHRAEVVEQQRNQLYQFAKEAARESDEKQETAVQRETVVQRETAVRRGQKKTPVRRKMEKKIQRTGCRILLALAVVIPLARILLTRMLACAPQFTVLQGQLIPSQLYFCAALILIFHLVRRTYKPQWTPAVLLLLPLILDAWYLVPPLFEALPADKVSYVSSGAKVLISVIALVMSVKAGRRPAMKYRSKPDGAPRGNAA